MTNVEALLLFKEITTLALNKDKLRATDYRRGLLKVTIAMANENLLSNNEKEILLLFCEMMSMYYENDDKRSPRSVLRLYNISFRHGQAIQRQLIPPKQLTQRKLCGIYYHGAVDHAPLLYRLVCLRSICAELFERYFDRIEDITRKTWNKQVEDLVPNAYLHIQAEDAMAAETDSLTALSNQEKEISHLAKGLPQPFNTVITKDFMTKKSSLWQAHLSKIADFLKPGPEVWWKWKEDGSVEFFDAPGQPNNKEEGPHLHHFRSNNISQIHKYLEETWRECASQPDNLPLYKIRDKDGKLTFQKGNTGELQQTLEPENGPCLNTGQMTACTDCDDDMISLISEVEADSNPETCEDQGETTLEVILEDQQEDLEIAEDTTSD